MNFVRQKGTIVLFIAVLGPIALAAFLAWFQSEGGAQPIAFNHKEHFANNVSCAACHRFYTQSMKAGIPGVDVCRRCHEDVVYVSSEKEKLLKYVNEEEEIPWQQVYRLPDHVLFSHRRHVVAGKLDCAICHGDVTQAAAPITKPMINLDMDGCLKCHRTVYQNADECLACHR